MKKFIIKNISGKILHTSVRKFNKVSDAQRAGQRFLDVSSLMSNRMEIARQGNYVDVV